MNKPFRGNHSKSINAVAIPLIIILLAGMVVLIILSYLNGEKTLKEQINQEYINILTSKHDALNSSITRMIGLVISVMNQSEMGAMVRGEMDAYEKSEWIKKARNMMYYDMNDFEGFDVLFYSENDVYFYKGDARIRCNRDFRNTLWYIQSQESASAVHWFGLCLSDSLPQTEHFFGSYRMMLTGSGYGYIPTQMTAFLSLSLTQIDKLMKCSDGNIYIVDREGTILYGSCHEHIGSTVTELGITKADIIGGRDYGIRDITKPAFGRSNTIAIISPVDEYGLSLIHIREQLSVVGRYKEMQLLFYLFLGCILILIIYYVYIYIFAISRPLKAIYSKVSNIGAAQYYPVTTGLKKLDAEFNRVLLENKINTRKIDEFERKWQLIEIDKLQTDIDPHFLYNVLNHIRLTSIMENTAGIRKIIDAIFFILDNKRGLSKHYITVRKEVETLMRYIEIMQLIYHDNIGIRINIDPQIIDCLIPSFILQPIVENSIQHGINPVKKGGVINITSYVEDTCIRFEITDNGTGIREDAIINVKRDKEEDIRHMGIMNVDRKIKLCSGEEYGITIESRSGLGTKVTLIVAKLYKGDERIRSFKM